jgi:adenylate kinase family enzyme
MRIAFCGAGGVGKSTLVHAIVKQWPNLFKNYTIIDSIRHSNHYKLNQKQRQRFLNSEYMKNQLGQKFISSRSIYDVLTYSRITIDMWFDSIKFNSVLKKIDYDFLFYIPIEFPIEPNEDGTRPSQESAEIFQNELQIVLNYYHVPVNFLSGTVQQRLNVISTIMRLPWP